MLAGKLRHRVTLQSPGPGTDAYGRLTGWTDVAAVWADIRYQRGLEALRADATVSVASCSVRIRYRSGVTAGMRIVEGATVYDIRAVLPDSTGKVFLDLVCETGANNG